MDVQRPLVVRFRLLCERLCCQSVVRVGWVSCGDLTKGSIGAESLLGGSTLSLGHSEVAVWSCSFQLAHTDFRFGSTASFDSSSKGLLRVRASVFRVQCLCL